METSFRQFVLVLVQGKWMTSVDGDDYCSSCWQEYFARLCSTDIRAASLCKGTPTVRLARWRDGGGHWFVTCENAHNCGASILVPKEEDLSFRAADGEIVHTDYDTLRIILMHYEDALKKTGRGKAAHVNTVKWVQGQGHPLPKALFLVVTALDELVTDD